MGGKGSGRKGGNSKNEKTFRRLTAAQRRKDEADAEAKTARDAKKAFEDSKAKDGTK